MSRQVDPGRYSNLGSSKSAIQYHYDTGNALYERILGCTMAYSAGLWREPARLDTLAEAQNRKLDWHIDWSGADGAGRVLEVGCGWGSFIQRLALRNPKARVTGLTMSDAQAAYLEAKSAGRATIQVIPWQSFEANQQFDSIVSIEAIEHFADINLAREQRIQAYRDFFEFCRRHLAPSGRVTLQMTVWHNVEQGREREYDFSHFFPQSCLPHVSDLVAAADDLFQVVRVEVAPRDYIYTVREWLRNLQGQEAALKEQFGAEKVQWYIDNFKLIIGAFMNGTISLSRMALERRGQPVVWAR